MAAPTTVDAALLQNALGPAAASVDGVGSVTAKTAPDLIAIRNELKKAAVESLTPDYGFGIRYAQLQPPGAG